MPSYVAITRQIGLQNEMRIIANNIANLSTSGFRREGLVFAEYVQGARDPNDSVSMAVGRGKAIDLGQGPVAKTGAELDLALDGDGFFMVATPEGDRLTRNGSFLRDAEGLMVTVQGYQLLDAGGAPIFVPPDVEATVSSDGTLSVDGQALAQVGVFTPNDPQSLSREKGTLFAFEGGTAPVEAPQVLQGFLEGSNVDPVHEIARMIEVQRAYELGQKVQDMASDRRSKVFQTLTR